MRGVGLTFHPLLYRAMIEGRLLFDFVEAPLKSYLDPAQTSLADPDQHRLREISRRWPIVWRTSVFSLGSVENPCDASPDRLTLRRTERLLKAVDTRGLIETIGFRRLAGRDLGRAHSLPCSEAVADWIAARCSALQRALGLPIALRLPRMKAVAMDGDLDIFRFLERIAERSGCEFVLDLSDINLGAREAAPSLARLPVSGLVLSGEWGDNPGQFAEAVEIAAPRAFVARCAENLFPLDGIATLLRQAGAALKNGSQTTRVSRCASSCQRNLGPGAVRRSSHGRPNSSMRLRRGRRSLAAKRPTCERDARLAQLAPKNRGHLQGPADQEISRRRGARTNLTERRHDHSLD